MPAGAGVVSPLFRWKRRALVRSNCVTYIDVHVSIAWKLYSVQRR